MKLKTLIIGIVLLAANVLFGLLLSSYQAFNVWFTSIVIVINTTLILLTQLIPFRSGFAISLSFLYTFLGAVEFILGLVSHQHIYDNGYVIAVVVLIVLQVLLAVLAFGLTKKNL